MSNNRYPVYEGAILLFLEEYGPASAGRLHYHITGRREAIEECLAEMVKKEQLEQCGTETTGAYQGEPLYQIKSGVWGQRER